jgi:hypothetical protein
MQAICLEKVIDNQWIVQSVPVANGPIRGMPHAGASYIRHLALPSPDRLPLRLMMSPVKV